MALMVSCGQKPFLRKVKLTSTPDAYKQQNQKMGKPLFDTRPLKTEAFCKLNDNLDSVAMNAVDLIISGEDLPNGLKKIQSSNIIRLLISELN